MLAADVPESVVAGVSSSRTWLPWAVRPALCVQLVPCYWQRVPSPQRSCRRGPETGVVLLPEGAPDVARPGAESPGGHMEGRGSPCLLLCGHPVPVATMSEPVARAQHGPGVAGGCEWAQEGHCQPGRLPAGLEGGVTSHVHSGERGPGRGLGSSPSRVITGFQGLGLCRVGVSPCAHAPSPVCNGVLWGRREGAALSSPHFPSALCWLEEHLGKKENQRTWEAAAGPLRPLVFASNVPSSLPGQLREVAG